jgi:hypothetical protein
MKVEVHRKIPLNVFTSSSQREKETTEFSSLLVHMEDVSSGAMATHRYKLTDSMMKVNPVRNSSPAIAGLETERGIISNGVNSSRNPD